MEGVLERFESHGGWGTEFPELEGAIASTGGELQRLRAESTWLWQKVASQAEEIDQLRAELERLRRENLELRQQSGYWQGMHARAAKREKALGEEVERLNGEVRKLQDEQYGRRSEKQTGTDRSNSLEEGSPKPKRRRGQQPGNPGPKRRDYSHLPERQKTIRLPKDEQRCPVCGEPFAEMSDEEISEQIEIEIGAYRQKLIRKRYRSRCNCAGCSRTVTAPVPAKLIPKGRLGTSVWAEILLDKYYGHCSTGRLIERLHLIGLDLAPGTITSGLQVIEPMFAPIYEAICERQGLSYYYQADETRWLVFIEQQGKSGHRWWLWLFVGEDTCVFRLDPSRSHDVPEQHFPSHVHGVLLVDRYSAYKAMAQVKEGTLLLAFCWAHVRRDFVKVGKGWPELKDWAVCWLERIRQLYRLNRERLHHPAGSDTFGNADAKLREQAGQMRQQLDEELAEATIREPVRKTLESLQEHWEGLTRFIDDPRIPMDNNGSERTVRGPATGRKNYYGSGAQWSGRLAATLFSIFATLRLWQINSRAWLTWYLQACAAADSQAPDDISRFLPWNLSDERRAELNSHPPPPWFDTA